MDARVSAGEKLPLAGVPFAIKDNMWVAGRQATCGSRILEGFRPPGDATAVARLRRARAPCSSERPTWTSSPWAPRPRTAPYQVTRNPWDLERIPGGSSGGSAAAVCRAARSRRPSGRTRAARSGSRRPAAAWSDSSRRTGGSRGTVSSRSARRSTRSGRSRGRSRTPPGVYRGDRGRRSRSTRHRSGEDVARRRGALSSGVARDAGRVSAGGARPRASTRKSRKTWRGPPDLARRRRDGSSRLRSHGPTVAIAIYYVIASAEASSNLARFDGVRYGPRASEADLLLAVRRDAARAGSVPRSSAGSCSGPSPWRRATTRRTTGRRCARGRCSSRTSPGPSREADVIVCPSIPAPAFRIGEKSGRPADRCTSPTSSRCPASLAGLPAISVPSGLWRGRPPAGTPGPAPRVTARRRSSRGAESSRRRRVSGRIFRPAG